MLYWLEDLPSTSNPVGELDLMPGNYSGINQNQYHCNEILYHRTGKQESNAGSFIAYLSNRVKLHFFLFNIDFILSLRN